jgi:hypothetical protein
MNKIIRGVVIALVVGVSFAFGLLASNYYDRAEGFFSKPIMKVSSQEAARVTSETPIIMEKAYSKCRHMITSGYEEPLELMGKTVAAIQQEFTYKDGYMVWFTEDGSLMIHQRIEGWCPDDQERVHLGIFKGHVAVFRGPSGFDEEVLRVTGIRTELLPETLRQDLEAGILEYSSEDEANFVLENLDEYN